MYSFFCRSRARIISSNFYLSFHQIVIYYFFIYHRVDFIAFSSVSINFLYRSDISSILFLISFIVILFYSFKSIFLSFAIVLHDRCLARCFSIFHTSLYEFKLEDWNEWDNVSSQLTCLKRITMLSLNRVSWLLSLFSCKISLRSW